MIQKRRLLSTLYGSKTFTDRNCLKRLIENNCQPSNFIYWYKKLFFNNLYRMKPDISFSLYQKIYIAPTNKYKLINLRFIE